MKPRRKPTCLRLSLTILLVFCVCFNDEFIMKFSCVVSYNFVVIMNLRCCEFVIMVHIGVLMCDQLVIRVVVMNV